MCLFIRLTGEKVKVCMNKTTYLLVMRSHCSAHMDQSLHMFSLCVILIKQNSQTFYKQHADIIANAKPYRHISSHIDEINNWKCMGIFLASKKHTIQCKHQIILFLYELISFCIQFCMFDYLTIVFFYSFCLQ